MFLELGNSNNLKKEEYTMRMNFGAKAMCYPMPVYIIGTYNADGTPNAMNAAWGGISEETEISICVDSGHKTAENLIERKAFTVSMATADYVQACDYVGIVSGNKEPDKFAKAGFHAAKSEFVDAPLIEELPMALECRVISYDTESCRLVGEIMNVSVDETVLGENGKVDVKKLQPITYDPMNHHYLVLGEKVGQAFHDGKVLK
jgi:flavin reductase (DIM6/NTAB) family NADH-FMN oxidoreductase RutF